MSIALIRNDKGTPLNFIAVLKDINNKKKTEEELLKAGNFNQMIINTSPVGIVVTNQNGQIIIMANHKADEFLGLSKDNITQRSYNSYEWKITDLEGNPFPEDELPFIQVRKKKRTVENIKHAIEWPDGRRILLSINGTPQLDRENNFLGVVASVENITEKVLAENKIKESNTFFNTMEANAAEGLCVCHNYTDYPFVKFTVGNKEMTQIAAYTMDEINQLGWYQTLYPEGQIRDMALSSMESVPYLIFVYFLAKV